MINVAGAGVRGLSCALYLLKNKFGASSGVRGAASLTR